MNQFKFISHNSRIGSSETTREILLTPFHFDDYIQFGMPRHKPNPDFSFLEWFIGFFEAEGCLLKWPNKKKQNRFGIEITQKDAPLLYKIRTQLGFGKVIQIQPLASSKLAHIRSQAAAGEPNNQTYWRYYAHDLKNVSRFIWLLNGNLITEKKQKQFQIWLGDFNSRHNSSFLSQLCIPCKVLKTQPTIGLSNAWLSGFFEGDSGFWIKPTNIIRRNNDNSQSYNIKMKFYITQKNEESLLNQIKQLFQISSDIYQIKNGHSEEQYNRLETSLLKSHLLLIKYLTKYSFLGKRSILFQRWKRVLGYRINKYPITEKSIRKLQRLILSTK